MAGNPLTAHLRTQKTEVVRSVRQLYQQLVPPRHAHKTTHFETEANSQELIRLMARSGRIGNSSLRWVWDSAIISAGEMHRQTNHSRD
jgi:hypothetical protein